MVLLRLVQLPLVDSLTVYPQLVDLSLAEHQLVELHLVDPDLVCPSLVESHLVNPFLVNLFLVEPYLVEPCLVEPRPSKCLNHQNQRLCKLFLAGIHFLLENIRCLVLKKKIVSFSHLFCVKVQGSEGLMFNRPSVARAVL